MEHLKKIFQRNYKELNNKEVFLPIIVANSIICYKLAHDDEVYWSNFCRKYSKQDLHKLTEIYLFFIDFLPQTSQFESSYKKKVEHLKEFDSFLSELFFKQKFYYKNKDKFKRDLKRSIDWIPNPFLSKFVEEIFDIASEIRFNK